MLHLHTHSSPNLQRAQNISLILVSLLFLPLSTLILLVSYAIRPFIRNGSTKCDTPRSPKTILVTGMGMAKGLHLARTFHVAGHRVIGADFEPHHLPVSGRFSRALSTFYALPNPTEKDGSAPYIHALLQIVRTERVDLWVSCSGVASAAEDAQAKEIIELRTPCTAIQFSAYTTATLHEKHTFIQHTISLGLPAPETHTVHFRAAVHKILNANSDNGKKFILKPVNVDDATRANMTLLPCPTISQTYAYISALTVTPSNPYVLQQFIQGAEYCTHALIVKNRVRTFVACPSSDLQMHYTALPRSSSLSIAMLKFTQEFAARSEAGLTGHLSFDFLVEETPSEKGMQTTLHPIECNPRAHTAIVLFCDNHSQIAAAYLSAISPSVNGSIHHSIINPIAPLTPPSDAPSFYWAGNDLITCLFLPLLHFLLREISLGIFFEKGWTLLKHVLFWGEGSYAVWDPLPAWWLYHVYWPGVFAVCALEGRRWSRVNVSTGKVFGC